MRLASSDPANHNFQGYTILIIDDNSLNLELLSNYLEISGFKTILTTDGQSALEKAETHQPDIILLDIMMPGITGFEICQRLKVNPTTKNIPVIFMTAMGKMEDKIRGFEVGAVDYVVKPFHYQEILARVTAHLRIRALGQSLEKQNLRLQEMTQTLSKRALQLEISNQVGQQVTAILDLDDLLQQVVELIQLKFGYYFVGILLLNTEKNCLVLQARAGTNKDKLPDYGFEISLTDIDNFIVNVSEHGQYHLTNQIDAILKPYPTDTLPKTQAQLILPLHFRQNIIGILDIQSEQERAFDKEDKTVLQTLANQIAIAIRNAQLYKTEKRLRDLAEAANQVKTNFLRKVGHELLTPLHGILGATELLKQSDSLNEDQQNWVNFIEQSRERLSILIENVLALSDIESENINFKLTSFHFPNFLQSITKIYQHQAEEKGLTFNYKQLTDLPLGVRADKLKLKQILTNLLDNAVKFTIDGYITFKVKIIEDDKRNLSAYPTPTNGKESHKQMVIHFEIEDTGIGILPEQLQQIFSPFRAVENWDNQQEGLGAGLTISQKFIQMMGGEIHVSSQPDQGSTFWFDLPLTVAPEISDYNDQQKIIGYKGPRRNILIVDDRSQNLVSITKLFEDLGFSVLYAKNGQEGVNQAIKTAPDLILMDLVMPIMNGFEATKHIREFPKLKSTIIIAMSASVVDDEKQKSLLNGCNEFLSKPIHPQKMLNILQNHLPLEWIYQEPVSISPEESAPNQQSTTILPPPQSELIALYELAQLGDMRGIRQQALTLKNMDTKYKPFATKLEKLAKKFDDQKILDLIEQHLEERK